MKTKATHSTLIKGIAFALSLCCLFIGLCSFASVSILSEQGYYSGLRTQYSESSLFYAAAQQHTSNAWDLYYYGTLYPQAGLNTAKLVRMLDPANTNYRYALYNEQGERLAGTADDEMLLQEARMNNHSRYFYYGFVDEERVEDFEIVSYLDPAMAVDDTFRTQQKWFDQLLAMHYWLIAIGIAAGVCIIVLFVFLMCAAGRHRDAEAPQCRGLNRLPYDLYIALWAGVIALWTQMTVAAERTTGSFLFAVFVIAECLVIYAAVQALFMSLAARIKCRRLIRNNVISWLLRQLWRFVKWICRGVRQLFISLPILWKAIVGACGVLFIDLILILIALNSGFAALLCVLFNIAVVVLCCLVTLQLRRLKKGAFALSNGDFSHQIETQGLLPEIKEHAEALNGIGIGMGRAIEARMKSERMKTDLITNVSHDLKTPLTAIISYVDLLEKEKLPETAKGYVDILDQQAQRLKKLAEDVVEASKASSGAIHVNLQPTNLNEIVNQSLAEYSARFAAGNLRPILTLPETPLVVLADGRLLWRAIDNLLSNAAKYTLPGTRVYIRAAGDNSTARLSIRNVSKEPLGTDPAELTERFVRGDTARTADGSGLGLSIAQSLMTLQNGSLTLSIDDDLFKAELSLPLSLYALVPEMEENNVAPDTARP